MGGIRGSIEVILAEPRGFCAGVERAVHTLEMVVNKYRGRKKVYALHEIVHNSYVVDNFKREGVVFVNTLDDVPAGAVLVFSAHGVSQQVQGEAKRRGFSIVDATCPLVTRVHNEIHRYDREGYEVILIGLKGHREVEGSMGQTPRHINLVQDIQDVSTIQVRDPTRLAYVTQTTLSMDDTKEIIKALKYRFPKIKGPGLKDICYATQNRQTAVKHLAKMVDVMLVVGSDSSSNSNRLLDVAKLQNKMSFLIESHKKLDLEWLANVQKVGITAGASTPDVLIQEVLDYLRLHMNVITSTMNGVQETAMFKLPILD